MSRDVPNVSISIRAQRLVDLYREGRIQHVEPTPEARAEYERLRLGRRPGDPPVTYRGRPVDERCWLDPSGWHPGPAPGPHPNCRCAIDPGDPAGDQTVISVEGPDGTYGRLGNIEITGLSFGLRGVAYVPEGVEPLAPPPTWLRNYRPR